MRRLSACAHWHGRARNLDKTALGSWLVCLRRPRSTTAFLFTVPRAAMSGVSSPPRPWRRSTRLPGAASWRAATPTCLCTADSVAATWSTPAAPRGTWTAIRALRSRWWRRMEMARLRSPWSASTTTAPPSSTTWRPGRSPGVRTFVASSRPVVSADSLVGPHGPERQLQPLLVPLAERAQEGEWAAGLTHLPMTSRETSDLVMLGIGAFTPLAGFIGKHDWLGVCRSMTLTGGTFWPIPITLSATDEDAGRVALGEEGGLIDCESGELMGTMQGGGE